MAMCQLAARLAASRALAPRWPARTGHCLRTGLCLRTEPSLRIGAVQVLAAGGARALTQRAAQQSLHAAAVQTQSMYGDESMLLRAAGSSLLMMGDPHESADRLHYAQTGRTVTEQLSTMHACLANGNTEQAQRILVGMYRLYPEAMREVADVSVHNEIISGLLAAKPVPLANQALQWYDLMSHQYNVKPNANTFAILISGFVNSGLSNVALVLMQEMLRNGHTIHGMLLSSYLSDADISQIKAMAQKIIGGGAEVSAVATMLLDEMEKAEESLKKISAEPEDSTSTSTSTSSAGSSDVAAAATADATVADSVGIPAEDSTPVSIETITAATQDKLSKQQHLDSVNVSGIRQLRKTLETLDKNDLEGYGLQMRLERDTYDAALARFREINAKRRDPLLSADVGRLRRISAEWLPPLEALIEEEQRRCRKAREDGNSDRVRAQYGDFFVQLDAAKIATITILEALRLHIAPPRNNNNNGRETLQMQTLGGIKTINLVSALSSAIHNEIRFEQMKKRSNRHVFGRNISLARLATSGKLFNMALRRAKAREMNEHKGSLFLDTWSLTTKMRIGSLLISMLIEAARIPDPRPGSKSESGGPVMIPAFTHGYAVAKGRRYGIIKMHHSLSELYQDEPLAAVVDARHLPMLVPPRPWLTYSSGGYLTRDEPCMRMKDSTEQLRYLRRASSEDRLGTILAGLDALGMTKWAINRSVFDAVRKVWNSGRALAEIPPRTYDVPEPVRPDNYETDKRAMYKYTVEMREWRNNRANQHSQRCDCNYKIEIARAFLGHHMYFPHNMDFRGRAYPIPPHFNHLGNDLCRGLLVFHEGRPLTERGIYWLKIHLANLCGKDKLSHAERLQFVDDNAANISASADNPVPDAFLAGEPDAARPWWLDAESPWQALAACIEYTAAMRSPDPAAYVSHLHIHQDGTCNGLQHYAAMGRDRIGATEVNLAPSDRPQDVYSGILRVVERLIEEDARAGVPDAVTLRGRLNRKIVKQTVMTNVYGVTLIGAREQIAARLREVTDEHGQHVFDITAVPRLALYVARKIFSSLGEMFTQAQEIQNWLNDSARRISRSMSVQALESWRDMVLESKKSKERLRQAVRESRSDGRELDSETVAELRPDLGPGATRRKRLDALATKPMTTVVWTTPLGLTVVQPYRRQALRNVTTTLQSIRVADNQMLSPVNPQKQMTAFPPNFVHSLDASHMTLSAIKCRTAGLVFASVHDSYWTHACDIDKMNDILRDQFVALHEQPIMENLKAEFEQRFGDYKMPTVCWEYVARAGFDHGGVPKSPAPSRPKSKKTVREEEARLVEAELARRHLEAHDADDADGEHADADTKPAKAAAADKEADASDEQPRDPKLLAESMVLLDLRTIELIDPKKDLVGAVRQADQIAYTLSTNKAKLHEELKAVRAKYREKIAQIKGTGAKRSKKPKAKSAKKAKRGRKAEAAETAAATEEAAEAEAEMEADLGPDGVKDRIWVLQEEMKAELAAVQEKHPTTFECTPIIVAAEDQPAQFEQVRALVRDGRVAGRLVERIEWRDLVFADLPAQGDFDIKEVLQSRYFFS
ncbi:DNA-directed RNA polymerase [Coemansia javaensis]|uniref:DNA-directed RNA polymerase n=1 Tax=Coemansia javaensis TaxID=2761396 RepID=A0A9W8H7J5_9FUNG|nr:DNA-directed RNA polymerase [Coemansia javaensis]